MSDAHRQRLAQARKKAERDKQVRVAVFAAAALLVLVVVGTAAFFVTRKPAVATTTPTPSTEPAPAQSARPPMNINGVEIGQGPELDPTDVLHLVRARVSESGAEVKLLGIAAHRAHLGTVNLDDPEAAVVYSWLVLRRDVRAAKADELTMERVELTIRGDSPPIAREATKSKDPTIVEPKCVWSAAWRAAIASGLSAKDHFDVTYGPHPRRPQQAVWIFAVRDRPETTRVVDGESCAIKASEL